MNFLLLDKQPISAEFWQSTDSLFVDQRALLPNIENHDFTSIADQLIKLTAIIADCNVTIKSLFSVIFKNRDVL